MDDDDLMTMNHDEAGPSPVAPVGESRTEKSALRIFRATTESDILRLVDIALEYHHESRYGLIPFSREKFVKSYSRIVADENALSIVVEFQGRPVGLLGANVGEYFLGSGTRIATNYIFYVSPGIRHSLLGGKVAIRLMRIFTDWARAQGASEINIHATSGIEPQQTHRFLQKVGFAQYGGNYAAQLG